MKTFFTVIATLVFASTTHAQGPLSPPGSPDTTMRTLAELESRTPIESVPYTIDEPGSYYLTGNLDAGSDNGIIIMADNVTVDLMGFKLAGTDSVGMYVASGVENTVVRNGSIDGFETGVQLDGSRNGVYERLRVRNMSGRGFYLRASGVDAIVSGNAILDCIIANNGMDGVFLSSQLGGEIRGNRIEDSVIARNFHNGVYVLAAGDSSIFNNRMNDCTIVGNGTEGGTLGRYGVYEWSSDSMISGNLYRDNAFMANYSRGFYLRVSLDGHITDTSIINNNIHGHSNAGILASGMGLSRISRARILGNVVSDNSTLIGGIVFRGNIAEDERVENAFVQDNLLFGNARRNIWIDDVSGGTLQGNHMAGEADLGLRMEDSEGIVVTGNSVFGEPFTISPDDTYGPVVESTPIPNNAWANFRLEE